MVNDKDRRLDALRRLGDRLNGQYLPETKPLEDIDGEACRREALEQLERYGQIGRFGISDDTQRWLVNMLQGGGGAESTD